MAKLFLSAMLAFWLVLGFAGRAHAADPEREARERYDNAVKLYEEGAYDAALVELNRAAELRPSYKLYYNIGQVRYAMHDYAAAIDAYRRYLDQGGDKIPSSRREQVQKELNELAQRVAKLTIDIDVPGAEILIDDAPVGTSPLAGPLIVNSGIRLVTVRHPDYLPQTRRITLAGNVQDKVSFTLVGHGAPAGQEAASANATTSTSPMAPVSSSGPPPFAVEGSLGSKSSPQADATRHHPSSTAVWVGWATTGALAVGATVTGVVTLSKNSKLADDRGRLEVSDAQIEDQASHVRTLAIVTDVLTAGAVVAGGVSLWLTLDHLSGKKASAASASARSFRVGVAPRGVRLETSF